MDLSRREFLSAEAVGAGFNPDDLTKIEPRSDTRRSDRRGALERGLSDGRF
jgi:hypothetical protein